MLITFLNPLFHLIFRKPPYKNRTERILNTNPNQKKMQEKNSRYVQKQGNWLRINNTDQYCKKTKVIRLFSVQSVIGIPAYEELLNSWTA